MSNDLEKMSVDELREYAAERMGSGYWEEAFDELARRLREQEQQLANMFTNLTNDANRVVDIANTNRDRAEQAAMLHQDAETMKEGWVSVPEEPTFAMWEDMHDALVSYCVDGKTVTTAWKAALAARPKEKEE